MPQYFVTSEVVAKFTINRAIEAQSFKDACNIAASKPFLHEHLPEDFAVNVDYCETETDAEELTAICPNCSVEHLSSSARCANLAVLPNENYPAIAKPYRLNIYTGDLRFCPCDAFPHEHLRDTDDKCVPTPWWHEDTDYCAECGAKINAGELIR